MLFKVRVCTFTIYKSDYRKGQRLRCQGAAARSGSRVLFLLANGVNSSHTNEFSSPLL